MKNIALFLSVMLTLACHGQSSPAKANGKSADTSYVYDKGTRDGTGKYFMGREIAFVMGAAGAEWLERPERQQEENAELAIKNMKLKPGGVVADIGAGTGYYSFRIARKVPQGKVYAVEIQDELIAILNKRRKEMNISNLEIVTGDTLNVNLPPNTVDLAIMVDVYHELSWPKEIIRSINLSLKPTGRILLIEYRGEDPAVPIKPVHKMTVAQLNKEMRVHGFEPDMKGDFLPIQHFLLYKKIKSE